MTDPVDWRANLDRQLRESREQRQKKQQRYGFARRAIQSSLRLPRPLHDQMNLACQQLDISAQGFIRRAVAVAVSRTLDVDVYALLRDCPLPMPYGEPARFEPAQVDPGDGIDLWCCPGCDGKHLRQR
jgi:hypothetical protein